MISYLRLPFCVDQNPLEKLVEALFTFGAVFLSKEEVLACLSIILNTQGDQDERHLRRIQQISDYEN